MTITAMKLDSLGWHEQLAALIDSVSSDCFSDVLARTVGAITPYNSLAIYRSSRKSKPSLLFHNIPDALIGATLTDYADGPYMLDPITQACLKDVPSGLYHLSELAPDHFMQSEYYKRYYKKIVLKSVTPSRHTQRPG